MVQHVFEGTWEQIARQAENLAGKYVRLTVIADAPADSPPSKIPLFLTATPDDFQRAFDALGAGNESLPVLPPEAFERESLYVPIREGRLA